MNLGKGKPMGRRSKEGFIVICVIMVMIVIVFSLAGR